MNLHKRSCCSTWVSAKGEHGVRERFAKETFLFAKNGRCGKKEFRSTIMYVCMYVCMYVRMYVCTYVRMYVCAYVRNVRMYVRNVLMYVCTYVRMYVCTYVRMYVCTYVRTYVRTYVCMYVCMYVCLCAHVGDDEKV